MTRLFATPPQPTGDLECDLDRAVSVQQKDESERLISVDSRANRQRGSKGGQGRGDGGAGGKRRQKTGVPIVVQWK